MPKDACRRESESRRQRRPEMQHSGLHVGTGIDVDVCVSTGGWREAQRDGTYVVSHLNRIDGHLVDQIASSGYLSCEAGKVQPDSTLT